MKRVLNYVTINFDKLFFLFQLIAALLMTVITEYTDYEFVNFESLTIYLLILLAFDVYFIVVHRLDKIIGSIGAAKNSMDKIICERNDAPSLDYFIQKAKYDIFISGSTMFSLRRYESLLKSKLNEGINVSILLWNVCNDNQINALAEFDDSTVMSLVNQVKSSLAFLIPLQNQYENLDVSFLGTIYLTDYVAIDVDSPQGIIKVQNRLYGSSADIYPNYTLENMQDPMWFAKYKKQIKNLCSESIKCNHSYVEAFSKKFGSIL